MSWDRLASVVLVQYVASHLFYCARYWPKMTQGKKLDKVESIVLCRMLDTASTWMRECSE